MRDRLAQAGITDVELRMGRSGQFDLTIDGKLAFSRYESHRFPSDADIDAVTGA